MRYEDLPPLAFLPAVEAAGRLGSFKAAADALHVTPSAVSQQVRAVEEALNITLFERRGRAVVLTAVGARYLSSVRDTLRELIDASRRMSLPADRQPLRLDTLPFVAHEFVMPRMERLHERFPMLQLRMETSVDLVDLRASELDATIRLGAGTWPGVLTRPLGTLETAIVCSPKLAASMHELKDLSDHTIIEIRGLEERGIVTGLRVMGVRIDPARVLTFQTYFETMRAAELGLGVAMGLFPLTTDWVLKGRLAVPFPLRHVLPGSVALVHRAHDERFPFGPLSEWLREEYAALPVLLPGRIVPEPTRVARKPAKLSANGAKKRASA